MMLKGGRRRSQRKGKRMLSLDEAIRTEEDTTKRSENHLEYNHSHHGYEYEIAANDCEQSMIYHRQLAEWLKDYKRLLTQPHESVSISDTLPSVSQTLCDNCKWAFKSCRNCDGNKLFEPINDESQDRAISLNAVLKEINDLYVLERGFTEYSKYTYLHDKICELPSVSQDSRKELSNYKYRYVDNPYHQGWNDAISLLIENEPSISQAESADLQKAIRAVEEG